MNMKVLDIKEIFRLTGSYAPLISGLSTANK